MSLESRFGKILKQYRLKRGLSQEQLAFDSGLHRTYVSQLERGLKSPSLKTLSVLAKALKCQASALIRTLKLP